MNLANKITMSRIFMAVIIMVLLLFPFYQFGIEFPTYVIAGRITVDLKYIIAGVIFIVASITDFGKTIDAISDKILTNSLLIILASNGMISPIIAVVIVVRDIVTDSLKMLMGSKKGAVAAINVAKWKTATLMMGLTLTLFYNLPFALIPLNVADFLLVVAAILSVISGVEYYIMTKSCFKEM